MSEDFSWVKVDQEVEFEVTTPWNDDYSSNRDEHGQVPVWDGRKQTGEHTSEWKRGVITHVSSTEFLVTSTGHEWFWYLPGSYHHEDEMYSREGYIRPVKKEIKESEPLLSRFQAIMREL